MSSFRLGPMLASLAPWIVWLSACGHDHPPYSSGGSPAGIGGSGPVFADAGSDPACVVAEDAGLPDASAPCGCFEFPFVGDVPNLYFVLDRSGSMKDNGKWDVVRQVTASVIGKIGSRANFAAAVFPAPGSVSGCDPGLQVLKPTRGDNPPSVGGKVSNAFLGATAMAAGGGTPTAATLRALSSRLKELNGRTFVVLATDGGPNCNLGASCTYETCMPNIEAAAAECQPNTPPSCCESPYGNANMCLDADPLVAIVTELAQLGIPTYVIGVPGSAPYATLLDRVAIAGGTDRKGTGPKYYRVDSADASAFEQAMKAIAAKATGSCILQLAAAPIDPGLVNVYLDDVVLPADATKGWTLTGSSITIVGSACDRIQAGDVLSVRVTAGCPTVHPN